LGCDGDVKKISNILKEKSVSENNDHSSDSIVTLKKSTFNKIIIEAMAALMVASFFGGYNLGGEVKENQLLLSYWEIVRGQPVIQQEFNHFNYLRSNDSK
jgi:hypothetical protein